MEIPKTVRVGKRKYAVDLCERHPEKGIAASICYTGGKIMVATHSNKTEKPFSQTYVMDSYLHELTHAILYEMGHRLARNEAFVTEFAGMLTKALYRKPK